MLVELSRRSRQLCGRFIAHCLAWLGASARVSDGQVSFMSTSLAQVSFGNFHLVADGCVEAGALQSAYLFSLILTLTLFLFSPSSHLANWRPPVGVGQFNLRFARRNGGALNDET